MYSMMGGELPTVTRLVVQPWFAPMLALLPAGGLGCALAPHLALRAVHRLVGVP